MAPWTELELHQDVTDLLAAAAAIAGLVVCLLGSRVWRAVLAGAGFAAGCLSGVAIAAANAPNRPGVAIGLGLTTGCVVMIAMAGLPRLGTCVVFATIGWFVARLLVGHELVVSQNLPVVLGLAGALVCGLAPLYFEVEKSVIMLVSAIAGAWAVVWATGLYFDLDFHRASGPAELLASAGAYRGELTVLAALAAAGLAFQIFTVLRAGPDTHEVRQAMARADLPTRRRVAVLDDLAANGLLTRSEYFRHLARILSGVDEARARREAADAVEGAGPTASRAVEPGPSVPRGQWQS